MEILSQFVLQCYHNGINRVCHCNGLRNFLTYMHWHQYGGADGYPVVVIIGLGCRGGHGWWVMLLLDCIREKRIKKERKMHFLMVTIWANLLGLRVAHRPWHHWVGLLLGCLWLHYWWAMLLLDGIREKRRKEERKTYFLMVACGVNMLGLRVAHCCHWVRLPHWRQYIGAEGSLLLSSLG